MPTFDELREAQIDLVQAVAVHRTGSTTFTVVCANVSGRPSVVPGGGAAPALA